MTRRIVPRWLHDPLLPTALALVALVLFMPALKPVFALLFPGQDRPLFEQDSFLNLTLAHIGLVAASSAISVLIGVTLGLFVTRPAGREFRPLIETVVAAGQTFPPVAVLAVAVPLLGFGALPALIALALYGLLPVTEATVAAMEQVPASAREAARGIGMSGAERLRAVELPLAAAVILAGIRTSVIINIGTAAIASTVGAKTLGLPIIIGLSGFNTAYVLQGALVVALLAVTTDLAFDRLGSLLGRWSRDEAPPSA